MRMEVGFVAEPPSHDLGHEVFLVLEGRAEFDIDGEKECSVLGRCASRWWTSFTGSHVLDDACIVQAVVTSTLRLRPTARRAFWT